MNGLLNSLPCLKYIHREAFEPDGLFEKTALKFASDPGTVVLLSGTELDCARYHILAADPWLSVTGKGRRVTVNWLDREVVLDSDPLDVVDSLLEHFKLPYSENTLPVSAGLFGYLAYDLKNNIEKLPQTCMDPGLPDICLYAPSVILVHDRFSKETWLSIPVIESGTPGSGSEKEYLAAKREWFFEKVSCPVREGLFAIDNAGFKSSFSKPQYLDAVRRIIAYLKAGDIYQANLSQRFSARFSGDPYSFFMNLFEKNPAPFFSFVNAGNHTIVSTSPERFIKQDNRDVETRPIKGTISRGKDPAADQQNAEQLLASLKDDAELTMIVDLMRNDLSRVTCHGTVEVREHKRLEPYDNVFHLVSVVTGKLEKRRSAIDLIRATFPGGSITGCPKIRSMEIIDELEPVKRHVYTGSIGYISFHDTLDLSIAIRTAVIFDHTICFSVGGGIVYDSDPQKEYQETLDKGKTIIDALSGTAKGMDITRAGKTTVWMNGKLCPEDEAVVSAMSQGFMYGAGLFETIRVENGVPLRLEEHVNRLNTSWERLFGTSLPDITWKAVVDLMIRENSLGSGTAAVKIIAAVDDRELTCNLPFMLVTARKYTHRLKGLGKNGLDLMTSPYPRQSHLADHKTLNYLYYYLAGRAAKKGGGDEALILNPDTSISETNTCSIFMVSENRITVPLSDHVLPGVTLKATLAFLSGKGYEVIVAKVFKEKLTEFGSVILTNALVGAVPVISIDGIGLNNDEPATQSLCSRINRFLSGAAA